MDGRIVCLSSFQCRGPHSDFKSDIGVVIDVVADNNRGQSVNVRCPSREYDSEKNRYYCKEKYDICFLKYD